MDFFFDRGKLLESNNVREIRAFFSPIDRLFGDYELRKLYPFGDSKKAPKGLAKLLYRKNNAGDSFKIRKDEVLDNLKERNNFLGLVITEVDQELRLDYFWTSAQELIAAEKKTAADFLSEKAKKDKEFTLKNPNYFWKSTQELIAAANKIAANLLSERDEKLILKNPITLKSPILILEPTHLVKIADYIEGFIDARIGQYEDGMYVVFLHPRRNESDMPIRIPRPPKEEENVR